MKRLILSLVGGGLLWMTQGHAQAPAPERLVRIELTDGTVVEGVVVSDEPDQIVVVEERAGGTIRQNRAITRGEIARVTDFTAAEQHERAHRLAVAELKRYQLNPAQSYQAAYYTQVIDRVFRPFLEQFPESPQAADVRARIDAWTLELDRVRTGRVKYQGDWMDAAAAAQLQAAANQEAILEQARALMHQNQFTRALAKLQPIDTPAAVQLKAEVYQRWVPYLEQQQQELQQAHQAAQERLSRAQAALGSAPRSGLSKDLSTDNRLLGDSGREIIAYNKAKQEVVAAQSAVSSTRSQLGAVEYELTRVRPLAVAAGAVTASGEPAAAGTVTASGETTTATADEPLYVSVPAQHEDWSNPTLLQNIVRFVKRYWVAGAVVVVLGLWVISRRLAR